MANAYIMALTHEAALGADDRLGGGTYQPDTGLFIHDPAATLATGPMDAPYVSVSNYVNDVCFSAFWNARVAGDAFDKDPTRANANASERASMTASLCASGAKGKWKHQVFIPAAKEAKVALGHDALAPTLDHLLEEMGGEEIGAELDELEAELGYEDGFGVSARRQARIRRRYRRLLSRFQNCRELLAAGKGSARVWETLHPVGWFVALAKGKDRRLAVRAKKCDRKFKRLTKLWKRMGRKGVDSLDSPVQRNTSVGGADEATEAGETMNSVSCFPSSTRSFGKRRLLGKSQPRMPRLLDKRQNKRSRRPVKRTRKRVELAE
jgi:hypothetical protein